MDPFAIGVLVVVFLAVVAVCLAARASAGKPLSEFGQRRDGPPPKSAQALEDQDLQEMLDATNALRRARALPERSLADALREFETG